MADVSELSKSEVIDRFNSFRAGVRTRMARAEEAAGELQRKMVVAGTAVLAGKYVASAQAQGTETLSVMGLSFEQTMAVGLTVAELLTEDKDLRRVIGGAADAFIAVSGYQLGQEMQGAAAEPRPGTTTP